MKIHFSNKSIVSIVVLIAVISLLTAGAAAAQETPATVNQTETPGKTVNVSNLTTTSTVTQTSRPVETGTPSSIQAASRPPETESDQDETVYQIAIDKDTRIINSSWSDGTVTFLIESDKRQRIKITDSSINIQAHEAVDIPQARHTIPVGRTEVTFSVENPGNAGITVATTRGMIGLSPGDGTTTLIGGPYTASDAQASGLGVGISISLIVLIKVLRRLRTSGGNAERIA